ncbi:MAG TPA: Spy/CpxP family protein refolding chaperone [Thermoanaerobaculia bacterium]|nr:Spy/CpxP family protein refolding chaperone [Thermoanaerobaculia bacterium]
MNRKRIALTAAAIALAIGVAAGVAQPPPPDGDDRGLDPAGFFGPDDGAGGYAGPGAPGTRGSRFAAFRGPRRPGGPGVIGARRLADYLQLTDSQRESARKLFASQRDKLRPLFEQQRELRGDLDALLDDANASDAAIGQVVKQLRANRQTLKSARQDMHAQLSALLDANQKAKLEQLRSVMEGLRESARHRGRARS